MTMETNAMRAGCKNAVLISFSLAFCLAGAIFAPSLSADDRLRERSEVMDSLKDSMKPLAAMMRGRVDYDPAAVRRAAGVISDGAAKMASLFPEGSANADTHRRSDALPVIWDEWSNFTGIADALAADAERLASVADDKRRAISAFRTMARHCGACHEPYRVEK